MTTSEFIKMLQKADPSGNAHIRMDGGIPFSAELKEGYWDGPYSYIDEKGDYVYSSEGLKVDIHCKNLESYIEEHFNLHDPKNWKSIKSKFKFKLTYARSSEREESFMKRAKCEWDEYHEIHTNSFNRSIKLSLDNNANGWTWFQNKLVDDKSLEFNQHHYYTWKIYDKDGNIQHSTIQNVEAVYKSGLFKRLDNNKKEGYYEWKIKK